MFDFIKSLQRRAEDVIDIVGDKIDEEIDTQIRIKGIRRKKAPKNIQEEVDNPERQFAYLPNTLRVIAREITKIRQRRRLHKRKV